MRTWRVIAWNLGWWLPGPPVLTRWLLRRYQFPEEKEQRTLRAGENLAAGFPVLKPDEGKSCGG
jgi:hypothetical protein